MLVFITNNDFIFVILRFHTSDVQSSVKTTEAETVTAPTAVDTTMNGRLSQDSGRVNGISGDVGGAAQDGGGGDGDNNASSGGTEPAGASSPALGTRTTHEESADSRINGGGHGGTSTSVAQHSAKLTAPEAAETPTRTRRFSVTTPRFSVSSPDANDDDDDADGTDASSRAVEGSATNAVTAGESVPSATTLATGRFAVRSPSPVGSTGVDTALRLRPPSKTLCVLWSTYAQFYHP